MPEMAAAGPRTPKLGEKLRALRLETQGKRHSYQAVVEKLADFFDGRPLPRSRLWQYEHGRPPDPAILWGLATLYGQDPFGLYVELVEESRGKPLPPSQRDAVGAVRLTDEESWCIARWRQLGESDRLMLVALLERMSMDPAGDRSPFPWKGAERRAGRDRRAG